jgi:hypothetical protein
MSKLRRQDIRGFLNGKASRPAETETEVFLEEVAREMLAEGYNREEFIQMLNELGAKAFESAHHRRQ